MYFDDMQALLFMEGHGVFVWTAYLVAVLVLGAVLIAPIRRRKRLLKQMTLESERSPGASGSPVEEY